MKISRRHFAESDACVTDHLRDATALHLRPDYYGLLPATDELDSPDFELLLSVDAQNEVQARLTHCRAVTSGGVRVEITQASSPLTARTNLVHLLNTYGLPANEGTRFSVMLTANPFERVPTGSPSPDEMPPRHPYSRSTYGLSFVPTQQVNTAVSGAFALSVGELLLTQGDLRPVSHFVPPCTAIASHPAHLQALHQLDFQLTELETDAFKIIHKVKLRPDKSNPLAELVRALAERTVFAIAQQLTTLRLMAAMQPPLYLLDALTRVAKQVKTSLDSLTEAEREELLKYFEQWSEVSPATLQSGLNAAVTFTYNHQQVHEHLRQQHYLWAMVGSIFRQLTQLEYIGKNKEGWQTFINENPVAMNSSPAAASPETRSSATVPWTPFTNS